MATGSLIVGATGNQDVDGLLGGVRWNDNNVLFNFPSSAAYYPANYGTVQAPDGTQVNFPAGFVAVSTSFQNMVRKALGEFAAVTNLTFTEVADNAASNISVARTTALGPDTVLGFRGYGFFPGSSARAGDIWFDDSTAEVGDTAIIGRGTWNLVLHELGHAMGLKHGHEVGGPGGTAMTPEHDFNDYSIMSYRRYEVGPTAGTISETFGRPQSLMMYDILALQTMHGANYSTNGTDTVYTFSTATGQMFVNGVGGDIPGNGAAGANRIYRTIWDGGGNDTYDLSNYGTNLDIDLSPGGKSILSTVQLAVVDISTGRTATGNVFNALLFNDDPRSLIENAVGGTGNDNINGNQADNSLTGNAGNDTLNGGPGNDTLSGGLDNDLLDGGSEGDALIGGPGNDIYVVDNAGDVVTENASEGTDTVQTTLAIYSLGPNVENLTFTDNGTHTGFGNSLSNVMTGGDGNDALVGSDNIFGSEVDTLIGGIGNDTFHAEFKDIINGGAGTDFLFQVNANPWTIDLGATSIEWMFAGFGNDTINAATQTAKVDVFASGGNDVVTGSNFDDNLWAGVGNDTFNGGVGDDLLFGDLGADSLSGGPGNDNFYADSADTLISGGSGTDNLYWTENVGANIDMAADSLEWAQTLGGNDTVTGAAGSADLVVFAGAGNDTVTGGSGADFLWGEADNDIITGNGSNDVLVGGTGADRLTGGAGTDNLYGLSGGGADGAVDTYVFTSGWGTDFVYDFENGTDEFDMTALGIQFSDLTITDVGPHAQVSFGGNTFVVVNGAGLINASDFLF